MEIKSKPPDYEPSTPEEMEEALATALRQPLSAERVPEPEFETL